MAEFEELIDASKRGALEVVKAVLHDHPEIINLRDELGATPLHHAAFGGHCDVAQFLVQRGADINAIDSKFGATPAGWAIEYLREMGGFLGIELKDFAYAIRRGNVEWTKRFLTRFPGLRRAKDTQGNSFEMLAKESVNAEIATMFESDSALGPGS
jgi:ankyrin repeat protein